VTTQQFQKYVALFRSRSDVYARHWQKGAASGYSPAYQFDWQAFNAHRARGGRLRDFAHKHTAPLTLGVFLQHVRGELAAGVYPILPDNTCCFLAADFDGRDWLRDCQAYVEACREVGLSAHLERSRSGKGGHVWVFFADKYPCYKARRIGLALIRRSAQPGVFQSQASFDRLFPNQDLMPRGGYGNLIALPLQGAAVARGNTVFLNPVTEEAYADQWDYVAHIQKHTSSELDVAMAELEAQAPPLDVAIAGVRPQPLRITAAHAITLPRRQLDLQTQAFLHEQLNFLNAEYVTKKRLGKPIYDVQKYFQLIQENGDSLAVPRGFLPQLTDFLQARQLSYTLVRHHARPLARLYNSQIQLTGEQERMVQAALEAHEGILVAPPGSGKTMMAMELAARRQKPALILVHRRQLLEQWVEQVQKYLNIPKNHIGVFSSTTKKVGAEITVGSLQTLARYQGMGELSEVFGTIIVDECHHIPAKTFRQVIARLNPEFLYGLTATPKRKHGDERLLFSYLGNIIATMQPAANQLTAPGFEIVVRKTDLQVPFQWKTDQFELLAKIICFDSARNRHIVADIMEQVRLRRKVLVLSERKEHLKILDLYLKGQCETLLLTGDDPPAFRTAKLARAKDGGYQVLLSTGQLLGEGLEVRNIDSLVLAFPFSFEGKLVQYTGRLSHSLRPKALIDYHDASVVFLDRQFKQRKRYYNKVAAARTSDPKFTPEVHHSSL
jgi:superfamily II DNA or RNA helicase